MSTKLALPLLLVLPDKPGNAVTPAQYSLRNSNVSVTTEVLDFTYDTSGDPYSLTYNGTTYYYVVNLQGDVIRLVSGTGATVAGYSYDPYGRVISGTGTMAEVNPLRYRGYYYDAESEFYYLQSRYYDPVICRFVNADGYASTGQGFLGWNMFAYCSNEPIKHQDSEGAKKKSSIYGFDFEYESDGTICTATASQEFSTQYGKVTVKVEITCGVDQELVLFDSLTITVDDECITIEDSAGTVYSCNISKKGIDLDSLSLDTTNFLERIGSALGIDLSDIPEIAGFVNVEEGFGVMSTASVNGVSVAVSVALLPNVGGLCGLGAGGGGFSGGGGGGFNFYMPLKNVTLF